MKHRFRVLVASFFLVSAFSVKAQTSDIRRSIPNKSSDFEFVAGMGFSVINSDNRGHNFGRDILDPIINNGYGPSLSAGLFYKLSPSLGFLSSADFIYLEGEKLSDARTTSEFDFHTYMVGASGSVVYNFLDAFAGSRVYQASQRRSLIPYAKVGIGFMYYNANSYDIDGYPEEENSSLAAFIPVGLGVKMQLTDVVTLSPEATLNLTSTDYLDNVKRSGGYLGKPDHYLNFSVKVHYNPFVDREPRESRERRQNRRR
ncbi:DUF6089 family protein [Pontibacter ummariensis]|nr:DUF6089 family protein [Pontibacter ummariensis]